MALTSVQGFKAATGIHPGQKELKSIWTQIKITAEMRAIIWNTRIFQMRPFVFLLTSMCICQIEIYCCKDYHIAFATNCL